MLLVEEAGGTSWENNKQLGNTKLIGPFPLTYTLNSPGLPQPLQPSHPKWIDATSTPIVTARTLPKSKFFPLPGPTKLNIKTYDLCVLGSGPAGQNVAVKLAKEGWSILLVESRQLGGTCALRGCNPKKVLSNAAKLFDAVDQARGKMTTQAAPSIDWATIREFQNQFTDPVPESTRKKLDDAGIDFIIGQPEFQKDGTLKIENATISAAKFVIATGGRPADLNFPGSEFLTQSDQFLELDEMPGRVLFVGGGYISMEFAHVALRCGSKVTVVDRGERILKQFDQDLAEPLCKYSRDAGINIELNRRIDSVTKVDDGQNAGGEFVVTTSRSDNGSETKSFHVDLVVHGAGRIANVDGLNLDSVGGRLDHGGIEVDQYSACIGTENLYAVGDCAASSMPSLTPTAEYEAKRLVKNLIAIDKGDKPVARRPGPITAVAFTPVCIASTGISHDEAVKSVSNLVVKQRDTSTWGSVRKTAQACAGYKVLIDADRDRVIGAHLLGPGAEEQINLFALAIAADLTVKQLRTVLFGYPTFGADIQRMI